VDRIDGKMKASPFRLQIYAPDIYGVLAFSRYNKKREISYPAENRKWELLRGVSTSIEKK